MLAIFSGLYYFFIFFIIYGLSKKTKKTPSLKTYQKVSVVIAARNEEENISNLIKDLINQDYPKDFLKIIIVNDRSSDKTPVIINSFQLKYKYISQINVEKENPSMTPKKNALTLGINYSNSEIIVSTDADCRVPPGWVSSMAATVIKYPGIVIGYSKIDEDNSYFNSYQTLDFLGIMSSNAGFSKIGFPCSGSGQNIAYRKKDFEAIQGFDPVKTEISGDDMYLVQTIDALIGSYCNTDENSFVTTKPETTISGFLNQRTRWSSNSRKNSKTNILLFSFLLTALICNSLVLISLFLIPITVWLCFFFSKMLLELIVLKLGGKIFKTKTGLVTFIIWSLIQPIYIPYIALFGFKNKFIWKP